MANVAVGHLNLADGAGVALSASSSVIFMPVSELLTLHVGRKWRGDGGDTESIVVDLGSVQPLDTVALMGTNLLTTGVTRVRVSATDTTGAAGELFDSGALVGEVDEAYGYLVTLLAAPVTGRYVRIDLTQSGAEYIEAGRVFVGLRDSFEVNADYGWSYSWTDPSRVTKSIAGQSYVDSRESYRVFEMAFSFTVEADRRGFVEQIDRINGRKIDVLWIVDPDDVNLGYVTVWGLMSEMFAITQPLFDRWSKSYRIEERL